MDILKRPLSHPAVQKAYLHKRLIISTLALIMLVMIYFFKDSSLTLRTITFIGLIVSFYIADHLIDVRFRFYHYGFVIIIGITTLLFSPFYYQYPQYDKIQHLILPMFICSITFFMINKLHIALKWKITLTVFSVGGLLGIFEIGEYVLDSLFDLKLQGVYLRDLKGLEKFNLLLNPLDDTMVDLAFGLVGSFIYAIYARWKYSRYIN